MTTDQTGRFLFTAFYTAGMVTVHGIASDGSVVPDAIQTIQTSHGCHSIQVDRSNRFVYVPCVAALATQAGGDPNNLVNGGNRIFQFAFDSAKGLLTQTVSSPMIPVRELPLAELFRIGVNRRLLRDGRSQRVQCRRLGLVLPGTRTRRPRDSAPALRYVWTFDETLGLFNFGAFVNCTRKFKPG